MGVNILGSEEVVVERDWGVKALGSEMDFLLVIIVIHE